MFKKIIFVLLIIIPTQAYAQNQIKPHLLPVKQTEKKIETSDMVLASTFVLGQILNTGNMIYQQNSGYYEINPVFGKHPGKDTIYAIKGLETLAVLGSLWLLKDYRKHILIPANVIVWGTIAGDLACGVQAKFEFN